MQRIGGDTLKAADKLVLPLGTGVEATEAIINTVVYPLPVTGLEMQRRDLLKCTPIAAIKGIFPLQIKRACQRLLRRFTQAVHQEQTHLGRHQLTE